MRRVGEVCGVPLFAVDAWDTDLQVGTAGGVMALLASEWQAMVIAAAFGEDDTAVVHRVLRMAQAVDPFTRMEAAHGGR